MKRLAHVLVVVSALFITASFLLLCYKMIDLSLDDPLRRAGQGPEYPPLGTFVFYWECTLAVCRSLVAIAYPYGIITATAFLAAVQLFWPHLSAYRTSSRLGFVLLLLVTLIYGRSVLRRDMTLELFLFIPFPAPLMLFFRRLWTHALFLLSCWACCTLIASGVVARYGWNGLGPQELAFFIVSCFSILFVHCYLIVCHGHLPRTNRGEPPS